MRQLQFSPDAAADLVEIAEYIAQDDPARALSFVEEIEKRCVDLLPFPDLRRSRHELMPDLRSMPHGRYVVFCTPGAEMVRIERILHGARDIEAQFGTGD